MPWLGLLALWGGITTVIVCCAYLVGHAHGRIDERNRIDNFHRTHRERIS